MKTNTLDCELAVVGAGPYGLSVANHLRAAGMEVRVFGKVMESWDRQMPVGMRLRSPREGTSIAHPGRALTLDEYEKARGRELTVPLPLEDFVGYGKWFQQRSLPDLEQRRVVRVEPSARGFDLELEDGESVCSRRVVVATGIASFQNRPTTYASLPPELSSHTGDPINRDLGRFSGRRVVVVGGGQSAIESAALMHEAGAEVEVLVRERRVCWLRYGTRLHDWLHSKANPLRGVLYPPGNVGPPGINWLIETPKVFRKLPRGLQNRAAELAIRPAASGWLRPRTAGLSINTRTHVVSTAARGDKVHLELSDSSERCADHVLLGTGYKVSISRYGFLCGELVRGIHTRDGYPVLNPAFESSVPGLHFVGAPAAYSFGPICRFVAGTRFAAATLASHLARSTMQNRAQARSRFTRT